MKHKSLFSLALACLTILASCVKEDQLSTEQFSDTQVRFSAFAPNPVARGGALRILGSNLQKVSEVVIPGVDPIHDIEVISEGKISEIRVIIPVDGPEVGLVSVVADNVTYTSKTELTYSEPIEFTGFSPLEAMPGDIITVKGDYMNNIRQITFAGGTVVTEFEKQSRYELQVCVPPTAVSGKIILGDVDENNNPDGLVSNLFYSEEELTIGDPTIKDGEIGLIKAGSEVVVEGEYLNMIKSISFGEVGAEFSVSEDATSLSTTLPETAVDAKLTLTSYAGKTFEYADYSTVVPSELAVSAERFKAGNSVSVSGKDLDLVTAANLSGVSVDFVYDAESSSLSFTIPAKSANGPVNLGLANGKWVSTDELTLVVPVISSLSPLSIYAGDGNITVSGEDLDLVVSATLGGSPIEIAEGASDTQLELVTTATSVGGKVALALENGVVVESEQSIEMQYHALVVVSEMPAAQHIGEEVVLKGTNFDLVENVFIGNEKVTRYISRTAEELRFLMPYNKIGSYPISFHLFNGDVETLANPIEVQLERTFTTAWEGNISISWGDGGRVAVPVKYFEGVEPGAKLRLHYSQKDQTWAQAQINNGSWAPISFPECSGTLVPTDIYGWFADGILDRITDLTLTAEVLDNIRSNAGDFEGVTCGIIIQGSDLRFTKVEIVGEISQETTIWEGEAIADDWGNQPFFGSDAAPEFTENGVTVGQTLYFYISPLEPDWKLQIVEGHWGPTYASICSIGNDTEGGKFTEYDLEANGGKYALKLTQEIYDAALKQQWWGGIFVFNGDNVKITKVTVL